MDGTGVEWEQDWGGVGTGLQWNGNRTGVEWEQDGSHVV